MYEIIKYAASLLDSRFANAAERYYMSYTAAPLTLASLLAYMQEHSPNVVGSCPHR